MKARELVTVSLQQNEESLRLIVNDYAHWDLAYELIQDNDEAGILDSLGTGATESELFDQLFILGPDGQLLHAFDELLGDNAQSLYWQSEFKGIWQELNQRRAEDHETVSAIIESGGRYLLVAATWVTPDDTSALE